MYASFINTALQPLCELRPLVDANRLRKPPEPRGLLQNPHNVGAAHAVNGNEVDRLLGEVIADARL